MGIAGGVTITSIDNSTLALKTADGWTRTITVTGSTKISRAGQTIGLTSLKAGDAIALRESKGSDGSYTISAINVILPTVFGQVTAVAGDTITIKQFGGASATIHVSSATTYRVLGVTSATLGAIKVGMTVTAQGTQNSDGSIQALSVGGAQVPTFAPGGGHRTPGSQGKPTTTPTAKPGA
ncbi:MAG: DUF5666 domain-containing protein, partial [Candidatus Limnocylindrales bacterium]